MQPEPYLERVGFKRHGRFNFKGEFLLLRSLLKEKQQSPNHHLVRWCGGEHGLSKAWLWNRISAATCAAASARSGRYSNFGDEHQIRHSVSVFLHQSDHISGLHFAFASRLSGE